jgi:hypothetical protein
MSICACRFIERGDAVEWTGEEKRGEKNEGSYGPCEDWNGKAPSAGVLCRESEAADYGDKRR